MRFSRCAHMAIVVARQATLGLYSLVKGYHVDKDIAARNPRLE